MLVVIALLLIFSSLFIRYTSYTPLWNQHVVNVEEVYREKIVYHTALLYLKNNQRRLDEEGKNQGRLSFNLGDVDYRLTQNNLELTISLITGKVTNYKVALVEKDSED